MFEKHKREQQEREAAAALTTWQTHAAALAEMAQTARTFRGSASLDNDAGIALQRGEKAYCVLTGALLVEPRSAGGHWEGRNQGVSVPVAFGIRYRIGKSAGHYVRDDDTPTVIDTGTLAVTDTRAFFVGPKHTREWLWAKCLAIVHETDAPWTVISVSNRQKASGVGYDEANATMIRFRIDLAHAVATGTADRLAVALEHEHAELVAHGPAAAPPPPPPPGVGA